MAIGVVSGHSSFAGSLGGMGVWFPPPAPPGDAAGGRAGGGQQPPPPQPAVAETSIAKVRITRAAAKIKIMFFTGFSLYKPQC